MSQEVRDLVVPSIVTEDPTTREILRIWTSDEGERVILRTEGLAPEAWGIILADVARHVATAYARSGELSAASAFSQLIMMFMSEIQSPSDSPEAT